MVVNATDTDAREDAARQRLVDNGYVERSLAAKRENDPACWTAEDRDRRRDEREAALGGHPF